MKDTRSALMQPLVLRPAYGEKRREPSIAESGLPGGGPSDKGLPLDSGIPGTSTFNKPVDDTRDFDNSKSPKDEDIHRVEKPDDMGKDRDRIDTKEDWGQSHDNIGVPGKGEWDTTIKTKYPYRDDRKHKHYASAGFVLEAHLASSAHVLVVPVLTENGVRVATKLETIEEGLNPKFIERGRGCTATLKRADVPNMRWLFAVDCGNGPKVVRMTASKTTRTTKVLNMDLHLSCSCPAWRWLGPEHWSQGEQYLDGKPRGTASEPVIRDPEGQNRVCKHVAAVLTMVRPWQLSSKKPKG